MGRLTGRPLEAIREGDLAARWMDHPNARRPIPGLRRDQAAPAVLSDAVRLIGLNNQHRDLVARGVHPVDPPRARFRKCQRPVHQANRIVQATEPFEEPFDRRATPDYSGDVEGDAGGARRLTCLTSRDVS